MGLFEEDVDPERPDVVHWRGQVRHLWTMEQLLPVLPLHQNTIRMYDRDVKVPRLECWFGLRSYTFGGRTETPAPWPDAVLEVKKFIDALVAVTFDSCFVNYYRDGEDSIAWHADDDTWIGEPIATRCTKYEWILGDGDVFVMNAGVQAKWEHSIPKVSNAVGPRLNLTFRRTVS